MTPPRSKTLLFLPAAAALMGCSANVASSAEVADAEASPVTAVVVVERSTRFDDTAGNQTAQTSRGEAVARFVRMRSGVVDDDALRMVGAAVDIPAAGTCTRVSSSGAGATSAPVARAVELLDIGAVSLEAEGAKTSFNARRLPDVVDLVSGVVYTGRGEEPFPSRGRFVFRAGGPAAAAPAELEIAPFAIEAVIAGEPADLRLNQDLAGQSPTVLAASTPVELTWTSGADASDAVYVDIASSAPRSVVTRCAFADAGHGVLPPSAIASDEGTLSVHRVHREKFSSADGRARGIESGEIRFDFARVVSFHRR
ncbi:MAG: hypothetical protein JWM74_5130 [Myxococcaceae bacterium]|nr:hypothetical protein [Myxococcaceae bacterium]